MVFGKMRAPMAQSSPPDCAPRHGDRWARATCVADRWIKTLSHRSGANEARLRAATRGARPPFEPGGTGTVVRRPTRCCVAAMLNEIELAAPAQRIHKIAAFREAASRRLHPQVAATRSRLHRRRDFAVAASWPRQGPAERLSHACRAPPGCLPSVTRDIPPRAVERAPSPGTIRGWIHGCQASASGSSSSQDRSRSARVRGDHARLRAALPLSDAELAEIEAKFGELPAEYRAFVCQLGGHGAGPYYGLTSPAVPEDPFSEEQPDPSREFRCDDHTEHGTGPGLLDGTITLAEQGAVAARCW